MAEQNDAPLRGSGFNTDPQTGDWDQLAFENHSLLERVRGENTDTDDALAIYVQGVSVTTKVFNIQKNGQAWGGSANYATLGSSPNVTFGTAVAGGSAQYALRQDATLLLYDGTLPAAEAFGSVGTTGSSSLAPRRDHVHPMPAAPVTSISASGAALLTGTVNLVAGAGVGLTQSGQGITITASFSTSTPSAGTPALVLGTTNAAGGTNFVGVSSTVQLYDSTAPATWAFGTAAAVGTGSFAARSNHGHGAPSMSVPALVLATINLAGSAVAPFSLDSTLALFTSYNPIVQGFGSGAAMGTRAFAARADHDHGLPTAPAASLLATTGYLASAITMVSGGVWYSATGANATALASGTYLITGYMTFDKNSGSDTQVFGSRIYTGASTYASAEWKSEGGASNKNTLSMTVTAVLAGSANFVLQGISNSTGALINAANVVNGTGNFSTSLSLVKLA